MEVRELKLIKNKDGHGTINYKICLPTKWIKYLKLEKEEKIIVYYKNNSIIIQSKGDFKMEQILSELNKELLNKEMTLLEMDNLIIELLKQYNIEAASLFENEYYCMENLSSSYYTGEDEGVFVDFGIIKENKENNLYTEVKIVGIGKF